MMPASSAEIGSRDFVEKELIAPHTLTEYAKATGLLLLMPVVISVYAAHWCMHSELRRYTLLQHIQIRASLWAARHLSINEIRIFIKTRPLRQELEQIKIDKQAKLQNFNKLFPLETASARWLNEIRDRTVEDPVIMYLHGGAYFLKTMPPQIEWLISLCLKLNERGRRLSILIVDYTVAPYRKYPTQLEETTAVYHSLGTSCNKIIILGDSAGGNLGVALLDVISDRGYDKPWALALVSPWVALVHRETGSYIDHDDYLEMDDRYWRLFCTPEQLADPRVNPIVGTGNYWRGKIPQRSACVWGEREVLRDTCKEWAEEAGISCRFEEPRGIHDVVGMSPNRPGSRFLFKTIDSWLASQNETLSPLFEYDRAKL